jgi:hypothetical protein
MKTQGRSTGPLVLSLLMASGLPTMNGISHAVDAGARFAPVVPIVATAANRPAEPHWVTDPTYPGDDLPPRGRSLFDFLVTEKRGGKRVQMVPFPFASLVQRVEAQMRHDRGSKGSKSVLIPLGRSLQRMAAAPEFFVYPRAVVAADGEPSNTNSIFLKDRLYLGYQEKANVLEVISYNEDAARFEFQVVTDYRAGGAPRVTYANRALCTACHQNAAPVFSRQVWDETNANPRVAALLAARRKDFYGIPVDRGVDMPNAIDNAKLRANRFAVDQLLWSEGCGGNDEPAIRCRAALFAAVLQYRLSGQQQFDRAAASYRDEAATRLTSASRQRWPGGLAIGDPDVPNRNPLSAAGPLSTANARRDWANLVHVAAAFDPLRLRPPLEVWRVAEENDVARLVAGLAEFIAEPDVERLDRELFSRAAAGGSARRTYHGTCRVKPSIVARGSQRIEFRCTPSPTVSNRGLAMEGRLMLTGDALLGGAIDRLEIDGGPSLRDIDLTARRVASRGAQRVAVLAPTRGGMHARGADGNALEQIELHWGRDEGTASLQLLDDFAPARNAIAALVRDNLDGKFDGFAGAAFRRARLMPALFSGLGAAAGAWCCLDVSSLPPGQASTVSGHDAPAVATSRTTAAAAHAGFHRYCGQCHLSVERAPPNFLAGDADAVEAKLKHCAPRIFVRLSMWRSEPSARAKTPMPPEVALHRFELSTSAWRDGETLADLMKSVNERLRVETGSVPELDGLMRQGYENLRACLPAG